MNNIFLSITLLIFLTISQANGQDFFKLNDKNNLDSYAIGLANGKIILQTMHVNGYYSIRGAEPKFDQFILEFSELTYNFNKIYLLNSELSIERELNFQSTLDSVNWVLNFQVDEKDNDLVVLVANLMADTTKFYMHWYSLDLELQHTLLLSAAYKPLAHRFRGWHFIINNDNNIVYSGINDFYEFDKYGTKINAYYFTDNEIDITLSQYIYQNSLGGYFSAEPQIFNYANFTPDLSIIEGVNYRDLQMPSRRVLRDCNRLALNKSKENAYMTGFVRIEELCDSADIGIYRYGEFVYKYNLIEPNIPTVFFVDTPTVCNNIRYGQFAIDLFYDDHIYYSHSDKDCGFIAFPGQEPTCFETYITVKCLDDKGNLRWKKYLGGDAAYLPQGVVATPDSGVVVFVLRHHPDENFRYEADIYVAKFDKHGNPVELPTAGLVPVNEVLLNNTIKVYPNPVTNYLIVEGLQFDKQAEIKIYNSLGQLVFNEKVSNNKINLHHLQNGYYTYAIFEEAYLIKADKVLKW